MLNVGSFDQCPQLNCVTCTTATSVDFDLIHQLSLYVDQIRSVRVLLMLFDVCVLIGYLGFISPVIHDFEI